MGYDETMGADRPAHRMEIELAVRIFGDGARPKPPWMLRPQSRQDFDLSLAVTLHDCHQDGVYPLYDEQGFLGEWMGFSLKNP